MNSHGVNFFNGRIGFLGNSLQVFVYLIDGMLIDSGPSKLQKEVTDFCEKYGIEKIVHTHFHEDHTGNTAYLSQRYGVPSYIHPESVARCRKKADLPLYRHLFWGKRDAFAPLALPETIENKGIKWEVIPTPGHCEDHVVLLDHEQGRLFTGDLFLHPKTKVIMRQENMPLLMASLRKLLQKEFCTIFCGHAGVFEDGFRLIEEKLAYLEELQGSALAMYEKGMDINEIAKLIFPKTASVTYISGGEWSSYHIIRSMIEDR